MWVDNKLFAIKVILFLYKILFKHLIMIRTRRPWAGYEKVPLLLSFDKIHCVKTNKSVSCSIPGPNAEHF